MAEDRMLSDEILLGIINSKSGGGGGGTDDYNDLTNQPQINNNTLIGNKTASDLGLVAAEAGKGLSANDYTDADKAIVGGVTAALAGKQGVLTAGKYIDIDANNEISVDPVVPNETFKYVLQQIENYTIKVTKSVNNVVVSEEIYGPPADWDTPVAVTLDEAIYLYIHMTGTIYYDLLIASDTHDAGYHQQMVWYGRDTYTENFSTVDHSGEKLITKSELDTALATKADLTDLAPAFSTATAYTVGQYVSYDGNIYKCTSAHSAGAWVAGDFTLVAVGSELESKQDKTDNSLQTTSKTVVGGINELKSGLTNYEATTNAALDLPENTGKNILMNTKIPTSKTSAGVTLTALYDADGYWSGFSFDGESESANYGFEFATYTLKSGTYTLNMDLSANMHTALLIYKTNMDMIDYVNNTDRLTATFTLNEDTSVRIYIYAYRDAGDYDGFIARPMLRKSTITDATYAPYIPSVESRIEAVESELTNLTLKDVKYTRYEFNEANTSVDITIPTWKSYVGIAHHPFAGNAGAIVIINSGSSGNLGAYQTSNVFTITKSGNVFTFTNGSTPMYLDLYEIVP